MAKKWTVMGLVDASYIIGEFEAETGEQAAEKAWDEAHSPSVCHQCARELEVGDVYDLRAWADDGESYEGEVAARMDALKAERDRLRAELELWRQSAAKVAASGPVKVLRPEDIKGAEGILKRRPE